jgi:hypothetical protein
MMTSSGSASHFCKKMNKQAAHRVMALPNVMWPWSIFYSNEKLLRKENNESLGVFCFSKLNIQNQLIVWEACAKAAKVLQYMECVESKFFENWNVWILMCEYWKLKIEICMWHVWNLKFWKLKCLHWDMWILKNWNLKFEISMWSVWNLKSKN